MLMPLWTFDDVLLALGGPTNAAALVGLDGSNVTAWRKHGYFPTRHYFTFKAELEKRGYYAPIRLFGFHSTGEHERQSA
jgi:hypothetical protein